MSVLPERKKPKLMVVVAFDRDENGDLQTVFGPEEQQSEERATRTARTLATPQMTIPIWSPAMSVRRASFGVVVRMAGLHLGWW